MVSATVPATAPFSSWPRGLVRERSLCWLTWSSTTSLSTTSQQYSTMVISTFGHFLVLPLRVQHENVAYHWVEQQYGLVTPTSDLSAVRSLQKAASSEIISPSYSSRVPRSPTDSLAPRNWPSVAGSFARPSSPCAPFPVSPLSCHSSDTRWLILWLATVLQGSCQCLFFGSLLDSPFAFSDSPLVGLRSFSLPLFHPALRSFARLLWFLVVFCGTGWASTSIDNIWPLFHLCASLPNVN